MFTNPTISCPPACPPIALDHAAPNRRSVEGAGSAIQATFTTVARSIAGFIPSAGDRSISEATLDSVERDRRLH